MLIRAATGLLSFLASSSALSAGFASCALIVAAVKEPSSDFHFLVGLVIFISYQRQ
jgi:hypothetical protein